LDTWYMNFDVYIFLWFVVIFFRFFLAFYVAFCEYRPRQIRVAATDPSQCLPSWRPRSWLWTMHCSLHFISHYASIYSFICYQSSFLHVFSAICGFDSLVQASHLFYFDIFSFAAIIIYYMNMPPLHFLANSLQVARSKKIITRLELLNLLWTSFVS